MQAFVWWNLNIEIHHEVSSHKQEYTFLVRSHWKGTQTIKTHDKSVSNDLNRGRLSVA